MDSRQLHLFVDRGCANVQRAAEDEREAQHVVHLVWIVRATGTNDGVRAYFFRQRRQNFRLWIGQRQDHRRTCHLLDHLLGQYFRARAAKEDIRIRNHIVQRTFTVIPHGVGGFGFRHIRLAAFVNNAFRVADHNIVFLHSQRHQQVHTGNCCRTRAGHHHPNVRDVFLDHAQTVKNCGGADDRGTVLIVVEYRNIHAFAQLLLNVEAFRRFNIFEVDTAKGRFQRRHNINEFIGIELVHFDIENVDTGKFLEQNALTFHDRFTGQRADIP